MPNMMKNQERVIDNFAYSAIIDLLNSDHAAHCMSSLNNKTPSVSAIQERTPPVPAADAGSSFLRRHMT